MRRPTVSKIKYEVGSGNVFLDIGFPPEEAAELLEKAKLTVAIEHIIADRGLTQRQAARICGTDQPTFSKVLRGRLLSVSLDRLASWLNALGQDVDIVVKPSAKPRGKLRVIEAA